MKKALVFGSGGAKGSYQLGVWKALRHLHMKFDIVTGASIGSINGALYASNKYYTAKRLWKNIKTSDLFPYNIGGKLEKEDYAKVVSDVIKGGMSFDNASIVLSKYIDEKKVRKSKIDYGLITVSLTTKKPKMLTKEQIPYGKLIDYICASSICYPFVAKKEIDNEYFIDGGFYDGVPINLAIEMGATDILVVDLNVFGFTKKPHDKTVNIDYIKMKDNTLLTLSFTKKYALRNMKLGYNDTMKYFHKLDGNIYTFKKGELDKNYKYIENNYMSILKNIIIFNEKKKFLTEIVNIAKFNRLFTNIEANKSIKFEINDAIDYLGELFNLKEEKIYTITSFNKLLLKKVDELNYIKINKNLKGKFLISYMYNKYKDVKNIEEVKNEFYNIALLFPKDFLAGIYLISLTNRYPIYTLTEKLYDEIISVLRA